MIALLVLLAVGLFSWLLLTVLPLMFGTWGVIVGLPLAVLFAVGLVTAVDSE